MTSLHTTLKQRASSVSVVDRDHDDDIILMIKDADDSLFLSLSSQSQIKCVILFAWKVQFDSTRYRQ